MNPYQWLEHRRSLNEVKAESAERMMFGHLARTDAAWEWLERADLAEEALVGGGGCGGRGGSRPGVPTAACCEGGHNGLGLEVASPAGITGEKVTVSLDWLNVTGPVGSVAEVRKLLDAELGPSQDHARGRIMPGLTHSCTWESGALMSWAPGKSIAIASVNGDSLALIPEFRLKRLILKLHSLQFQATRLDPAADVPKSMVSMDQVHAAGEAGHYRGFGQYFPKRPKFRSGRRKGDQAVFGSRENGKRDSIYDKELESAGKIRSIRFEAEIHQEYARCAWLHLVDACRPDADPKAFALVLGQIVGGSIDFVDRSGAHRHADRFRRLPWWQSILDVIGSVKLKVHRATPPLERFLTWLPQMAAGKFALAEMVLNSYGIEAREWFHRYFDMILDKGGAAVAAGRVVSASHLGFDPLVVLGRAPPEAIPI